MPARPIKAKEQYRLVLECRSSGLTDYQWCVENGICPGTFYGWVRRLRQKGYENIPEPVHRQRGCSRQEIVRIEPQFPALPEAVPSIAHIPLEIPAAAPTSVMELSVGGCVVRVPNGTDPELFRQAVCLLKGEPCQGTFQPRMRYTSSAATRIIREVLLFEKFCVKTDVYWTSDNTSRITMAHISLLYNYNREEIHEGRQGYFYESNPIL